MRQIGIAKHQIASQSGQRTTHSLRCDSSAGVRSTSDGNRTVRRNNYGATTAMVAVCAFVLVLVIVGVIQVSMKMSTSQMVRNSVDAGVLNIATHVPDLKSGAGGALFSDCNDITGAIGLTNINRVWGKVLLINANAAEMANDGQSGNSADSANQAISGAAELQDNLQKNLSDEEAMNKLFTVKDDKKPMVSKSSKGGSEESDSEFNTAYLHRGDESNISMDPAQFPAGTGGDLAPVSKGGSQWLSGYKNMQMNGKQFMFVPFRLGEMPHLVSSEEFQGNKKKPEGAIASLPPNAFFGTGTLEGSGGQAAANAIANPQHTYKLAIPHAYVHIKLEKNKVNWLVNGLRVARSTYEFAPDDQWEVKNHSVGCLSKLNGYASLGNEYNQKDLLSVLTALPGDHEPAFIKLLQRLKEIDSSITMPGMKALLSGQQVMPNQYDYVIYPTYKTADKTDPTIKVSAQGDVSEPWYQNALPDGSEKTIVAEEETKDNPNTNRAQVIGLWILTAHHVTEDGELLWTPGTGLNQCLGTLRLQRTVDVSFDGRCPP